MGRKRAWDEDRSRVGAGYIYQDTPKNREEALFWVEKVEAYELRTRLELPSYHYIVMLLSPDCEWEWGVRHSI
jgi:hypothetical protein